ncbi:MAG: LamG domain-containing protein, partial [Victivallales bacterium]
MKNKNHAVFRSARIVLPLVVGVTISTASLLAKDDPDLLFYAPYDGSTSSVGNTPVSPLGEKGLSYVPGVRGQAVKFGSASSALTYSAADLFAPASGSVEFWIQPDWDGYHWNSAKVPAAYSFFEVNAPGKDAGAGGSPMESRIKLFMPGGLRCDFVSNKDGKVVSLNYSIRAEWMKGDWWHVCLTWDDKKLMVYVNGIPVSSELAPRLSDAKTFSVGSASQGASHSAIDELRFYRRALNAQEINRHFREGAPTDFTFERRCLRANADEKILLEIVPGAGTTLPVKGTIQLRLVADDDGRTVAEKTFDLNLSERAPFTLGVGKLACGEYRLTASLVCADKHFQRSFPVAAYAVRPPMPASSQPLQRGECLFDMDCTKLGQKLVEKGGAQIQQLKSEGVPYLEGGSQKADRFGFETHIPNTDGSPVLVEATWPDDVARAMGLYMYPKGAVSFAQHRERLYAGIMAGDEYPSSGRMQRASYLLYPVVSDYLFEARTLISGMPAALARVSAYRLAERLPCLEIHRPANRPGRVLGHLDEDQSFEYQIAPLGDGKDEWRRHPYDYPVRVMNNLLDYMDYSGLQVMSYPLLRYTWATEPNMDDGPINRAGGYFRVAGWISLMLDMMADRGKQLIATVNILTVPVRPGGGAIANDDTRFSMRRDGTLVKPDLTALSGFGNPDGIGTNPVHPVVRARTLEVVAEILRRFGKHPAFKGIDLWCAAGKTPFLFSSLESGYGDDIVLLFERETGVKVPGTGSGKGRFAERFHYLTGPARSQWLAWRAKKTTELFQEIDEMVRNTRPDLHCYLSICDWTSNTPSFLAKMDAEKFTFEKFSYEQLSLDFKALQKMPSMVLAPQKYMNQDRWTKYWNGPEADNLVSEMNLNQRLYTDFASGGERTASLYVYYFESFMPSLKQGAYPAYFQDSDAKANGRFFLQDFALAVASQDASQILVGAQSLGTSGREEESREFAQAFCALPRDRFADVEGAQDPVTIRSLECEEGTYFYAVNLMSAPVSVGIELKSKAGLGEPVAMDLSSGTPIAVKNGHCEVELKPFQLRSFFCPKASVTLLPGKVRIPEAVRVWYESQVRECKESAGKIHDDESE